MDGCTTGNMSYSSECVQSLAADVLVASRSLSVAQDEARGAYDYARHGLLATDVLYIRHRPGAHPTAHRYNLRQHLQRHPVPPLRLG